MDKNKLREIYKAKRLRFDQDLINANSQIITNKVINYIDDNEFERIAIYQAFEFEVQTQAVIAWCIEQNIAISVPRVVNDELIFIDYATQEVNEEFGIVFVPLVIFDDLCNRIGMGQGYYDKWFKKNQTLHHFIKVGLAFDFQRYEKILPIENYDVQLDVIITEFRSYTIG